MTKPTTFAMAIRSWVALAALGIWSAATRAEATGIEKNLLRGSGELPQRTPRIINGDEVKDDRYPYFSLMYGRGMCGGVLISPRLVLTAAHCHGAASMLRIGAYESPRDAEYIAIQRTVVHPNYESFRFDMDIMIYQLQRESKHPYIKLNPNQIKKGDFTVIGFGDTDKGTAFTLSPTLQEVELFYVDSDKCDEGHGGNGEITKDMMCAEGKDADSCIGDSGGPLLLKGNTPEEDSLVGIVSWGRECAMKGVPGVYSRISYFYDWIVDTVCEDFPHDAPPYMGCKVPLTHQPTKRPTKSPTAEPTEYPTVKPSTINATGVNATGVNITEFDDMFLNVTEIMGTEGDITEENPQVNTKKPTRKPSVAPIPHSPNTLLEAEFVSWDFVSMGECQGHCASDIQCRGDLVCYQRGLSTDIPGCMPGPIGLNVDVCVDPFHFPTAIERDTPASF